MKFTNTIRFKLTAWYSGLLILLCLFFIFIINVVLTRQYVEDIPEERLVVTPELRRKLVQLEKEDQKDYLEQLVQERRDKLEEQREDDLRRIRFISFVSLIPLIFLSGLGGYLIAGQMLRPIKKLNKKIKAIDANNLNQLIEHDDVGDEFSELINHFNDMISRLHVSFDLQKQFVENAAHELKTPLAVIRANLESTMLDEKVYKEDMKKAINIALKSTDFMSKLIEDLLLLSLLENQIKKEPVIVRDLINETINQVDVLAKEKEITLESWISNEVKNLKISGNKVLLQRALMNIIENAIKYSKQSSKVEIITEKDRDEKMIRVRIKDQGQGIPKEDLKRIFERFYRVDKSRSRATGGFGLGLAISNKIIEAHQGEIKATSIRDVGSEFSISLITQGDK